MYRIKTVSFMFVALGLGLLIGWGVGQEGSTADVENLISHFRTLHQDFAVLLDRQNNVKSSLPQPQMGQVASRLHAIEKALHELSAASPSSLADTSPSVHSEARPTLAKNHLQDDLAGWLREELRPFLDALGDSCDPTLTKTGASSPVITEAANRQAYDQAYDVVADALAAGRWSVRRCTPHLPISGRTDPSPTG